VSGPCWTELGLEETTDARAIRKAYARRLKAIDPDTDPAAFIALREALDHALGWAAWKLADAEWQLSHPEEAAAGAGEKEMDLSLVSGDDFGQETDWFCPPPGSRFMPVFSPPASGAPSDPPEFEPLLELDEILLHADHDNPPNPEELTARTWRILDDPAMERIDHAERVEAWLARLIVDTVPHSDPVAAAAGAHFRWDRDDGRWDQNWDIQNILDRRRGLHLMERAAHPRHPHHKAWLYLTSNKPDLGMNRLFIASEVREFLHGIRQRTPQAEDLLNPHRVALWDHHFGDPNRGRPFGRIGLGLAIAWGGVQVLKLFLH
jgi:hypothetical protein